MDFQDILILIFFCIIIPLTLLLMTVHSISRQQSKFGAISMIVLGVVLLVIVLRHGNTQMIVTFHICLSVIGILLGLADLIAYRIEAKMTIKKNQSE